MHDIKAIQLYAFRPTNPRSSTRHSIHTRTLGFLTQRSSKSNTSIEKTLPGDPRIEWPTSYPSSFGLSSLSVTLKTPHNSQS